MVSAPLRVVSAFCVAAALAASGAATFAAIPAPPPLTDAQRAIFDGSPEDVAPHKLGGVTAEMEGKHYLAGNEGHLHLLARKLYKRGGGFVGVGSDQAYVLMGWQRPELAWLVDYDQLVVDVHAIYRAFFKEAATARELIALWSKDQRERAHEAIARTWAAAGEQRVAHLLALYDQYQKPIHRRLRAQRKLHRAEKVTSTLTNPAIYTYVRELVAAGRVRAMRVDLLADKGLTGIADAARRLGVPIRVVYTSNAEQYWPYSDQFRKNMTALPIDARSMLVRTVLTWELNKDYRYILQPMDRFVGWLSRPWVKSVRHVVGKRRAEGPEPNLEVLLWRVETVEKRRTARTR